MQQGTASGSSGQQAPPPAHGGAPRIPSYLPPPPPALSSFPTGMAPHGMPMSSVRQPLPAPTLHGSGQAPSIAPHGSHHVSDDQPLDLGAPTKRKVPEVDSEASPAKAVKLESTNTTAESCNGILFKVSEPSVLSTSEASNITTVENMAIKKEEPTTAVAPATMEVKTEVPTTPTSPVYVHKLKKAWIKSYTDHDDEPKSKKSNAGTSDYSAPSTPSNTRATPSPALSNASKSGGIKVNGHNKLDNESESSDSSSATNKGQKHSSNTGSKGHRGGSSHASRGGGRGHSRLRGYGNHGGQTSNKTSDNDAMSDSDDCSKDSDATTSSRRSTNGGNKGRRGRKPKRGRGGDRGSAASTSSKQDLEESRDAHHRTGSESRENGNGKSGSKKSGEKENPFNNPPINVLKKTGESFLQDSDCFKVAPKLAKCRECKWSQHNKNAGSSASIFCRFYGFRRLRYHVKNGQLAVAGFCDPHSKEDVTVDDAEMWEATADNAPDGLSVEQAKYCLELLKTDFDLIVSEERRAIAENIGEENDVSWKRVVQGVSESCDVCDATLFNLHWACPRCGFVVCLECYVSRKNHTNLLNGETKSDTSSSSSSVTKDDKDKYFWLLCTNKSQHDLDKLMLTQIVTGDALEELDKKLNNCGVKFRLAGAQNGKSKVNGLNGNGETGIDGNSGNGRRFSSRPDRL